MPPVEDDLEKMKFETQAVHAGAKPDPASGAVMTPIYQTSTYAQEDIGQHKGYEYSRTDNPTRTALQSAMAVLEDGRHALAGYRDGTLEMWRIDSTLEELMSWTEANRYIPELTCEQRELYNVEPLYEALE